MRCVILDRDGVINVYRRNTYVEKPQELDFIPGSLEALKRLGDAGYGLVVASNQAGVAKGYLTRETLDEITARMRSMASESGVEFAAIYYCTHASEEKCACRKPRPGLLERAAAEQGFVPAETWFIGDSESDVQAARAAGCRAGLVLSGQTEGDEWRAWSVQPDHVGKNLAAFVDFLLGG